MIAVSLASDRRDKIAALSAQRDYERTARRRHALARELRDRDEPAVAELLDDAADIAAKAAAAERQETR